MFLIYDCNGTMVGNPKGYKTIGKALSIADNRRTKAYADIHKAFKETTNNPYKLLHKVVLVDNSFDSV